MMLPLLIVLALSLFLGDAWHGGAATALEQGDFTGSGETRFHVKQRVWRVFLGSFFHAFFCDYFTREFLRIWRLVP